MRRVEPGAMRLTAWVVAVSAIALCGCARFQPKPINASGSADAFDRRNLSNSELRDFMAINGQAKPWPRQNWDLSSLTLAAFYYHPELDVARAKWRTASAAVTTAGERPNPSVSVTPTYDTTTGPPWIFGLSFDVPIETAGKRGHRIVQAKHLADAARLKLAGTAWQVRSRVRHALVDLHGARETEATLRGQAEAQAKVAELLEKQVAAGAIAASEASQSRINLNTTRLASQDAQRQSAEAQAQLADAVGVPAAALKGVKLSFDSMNRFPTNLVTGELRRQAALTRNDVLSALADYAASQASLQLELAKQFPDLHINPGYQLDQTDNKWTLGATLTLPVLNQNQGGIAEARARREEAAATFISVQAKALGEVDRAAAGYQAAKEQVGTGRTLVADLQQRLTATQQMLEVGEVDGLALATAKAEFSAGLLAQTTSLLKAEQALAVLEDAIQSPLALPVHGPVWEQNPRAASELRRD